MDAADKGSSTADTATMMLEGDIRALVRRNRSSKAVESGNDVLAAGATSITDIERLMEELQIARDFLKSEGERVHLVNARYGHMAKTASASVKVIAESLGKWRNLEAVDQAPGMMPRAPTLAPVHDGELHLEADDQ
jgi:hypothetical protein